VSASGSILASAQVVLAKQLSLSRVPDATIYGEKSGLARAKTSGSREEPMSAGMLRGQRVLILVDELIFGLGLARELEVAEASVIGPVTTASLALELLQRSAVDAAVLDYRLGQRGTSSEVTLALAENGIPFLFHTDNPVETAMAYPGIPLVEKTAPASELAAAVQLLLATRNSRRLVPE
jgi:hypothetical protein